MAGFDMLGRIWARLGAVSPPNSQQHDQGFSFLGNTPPSVELFNAMFQQRDEQIDWLWRQISHLMRQGGVTPANTPDTQLQTALTTIYGGGSNLQGWQRLANGLYLQWGTGVTQPPSMSVSITFPITFPNQCVCMVATDQASSAATVIPIAVSVGGRGGGMVYHQSGSPGSFFYMALGF